MASACGMQQQSCTDAIASMPLTLHTVNVHSCKHGSCYLKSAHATQMLILVITHC